MLIKICKLCHKPFLVNYEHGGKIFCDICDSKFKHKRVQLLENEEELELSYPEVNRRRG